MISLLPPNETQCSIYSRWRYCALWFDDRSTKECTCMHWIIYPTHDWRVSLLLVWRYDRETEREREDVAIFVFFFQITTRGFLFKHLASVHAVFADTFSISKNKCFDFFHFRQAINNWIPTFLCFHSTHTQRKQFNFGDGKCEMSSDWYFYIHVIMLCYVTDNWHRTLRIENYLTKIN